MPTLRTNEVIVFCTLAVVGASLFALVAFTDVFWFYPAMFYGLLIFVAWQRYFSQSGGDNAANYPTEPRISYANEVDLSGADLSRAQLSEADLRNTILNNANLIAADLTNADLSSAQLSEAILKDAHLQGADLINSDLSGADLMGASLQHATLIGANLTGAKLILANLEGANLTSALLTGADLTEAQWGGTDLQGAVLLGASGVSIDHLLEFGAILEGAILPDGSRYSGDERRQL